MKVQVNGTTLNVETKFIVEWDMTMIMVDCDKWESIPSFVTYTYGAIEDNEIEVFLTYQLLSTTLEEKKLKYSL